MNAIHTKATNKLAALSTAELKLVWDQTTANMKAIRAAGNIESCDNLVMVRGWIQDVLTDRLTEAQFDEFMGWTNTELSSSALQTVGA
jgi:hypothetical protein